MEKKEIQNASLGMFDLFKGIGMLFIIFYHTQSLYAFSDAMTVNLALVIVALPFVALGGGLMPAFFLIAGFGFRKCNVWKGIKQQASLILKPYLYTAIFTVVAHMCVHYLCFRYWKGAVKETIKLVAGFLLALPKSIEWKGISFFPCGPIWYLFAMMIGLILLNCIWNKFPSQYIGWVVALSICIGWILGRSNAPLFCLPQSLIAVGYIYAGYQIKKKKLIFNPMSWKKILLVMSMGAILLIGLFLGKQPDNMADGVWFFGPVSIVGDGILGFGLLRLILKANSLSNPVCGLVRKIGRYSLLVMCVHTVELFAVPWYLFAEKWQKHPVAGCSIQLVLRSMLIFAVCCIIRYRRDIVYGVRHLPLFRKDNGA